MSEKTFFIVTAVETSNRTDYPVFEVRCLKRLNRIAPATPDCTQQQIPFPKFSAFVLLRIVNDG
jgi:hypothetical protein